jgi:hypothetical protein
MVKLTPARVISTDIVAKLQSAVEDAGALSSDEIMVVLSEALTVIQELVALADQQDQD